MFCIYITVYSPELTEFLSTGSHNETGLADLEEKLITSFANRSIAWREGCVKNSYNYLLLDATVTNNLSSRMNPLGQYIHFMGYTRSLMPFLTIFQFYHGSQFNWERKTQYPDKTTHLPPDYYRFYHIKLYLKYTLPDGNLTNLAFFKCVKNLCVLLSGKQLYQCFG